MYLFYTGMSVFTGRKCKVYLDINTSCLLRFYNHISGVHYFYWTKWSTSKFWAPERWHKTSSILRAHKYYTAPNTIYSPRRHGASNMCTPVILFFPSEFSKFTTFMFSELLISKCLSRVIMYSFWNLDCNFAIYKLKPKVFVDVILYTDRKKNISNITLTVDFMWATGDTYTWCK